jgi:hypothetical protein
MCFNRPCRCCRGCCWCLLSPRSYLTGAYSAVIVLIATSASVTMTGRQLLMAVFIGWGALAVLAFGVYLFWYVGVVA